MTEDTTLNSAGTPPEVRAFLAAIGAKGGAARTRNKAAASRKNLARGRKIRLVRIRARERVERLATDPRAHREL